MRNSKHNTKRKPGYLHNVFGMICTIHIHDWRTCNYNPKVQDTEESGPHHHHQEGEEVRGLRPDCYPRLVFCCWREGSLVHTPPRSPQHWRAATSLGVGGWVLTEMPATSYRLLIYFPQPVTSGCLTWCIVGVMVHEIGYLLVKCIAGVVNSERLFQGV